MSIAWRGESPSLTSGNSPAAPNSCFLLHHSPESHDTPIPAWPPAMAAAKEPARPYHPQRRKGNVVVARVIPVFIFAIAAYVAYAITGPLAIQYLLNPPEGHERRVTAGLAIPIALLALLIPAAVTWLRLLLVVWSSPGYVPLGPQRTGQELEPAPGLEEIYQRDVFVCDARGLPIWCSHCNAWKPDRAHHNQDVGRCTMKMDHFCPWVGGVVGERTMKFFIQFNFYSFLLSGYAMSVLAYYVAERGGGRSQALELQWYIALGLSAFFCLFTWGMVVNSLWMVFRNVSTIENINAHSRTMLLAVLLPPHLQGQQIHEPPMPPQPARLHGDDSPTRSGSSQRPLTSELDDPAHSSYFLSSHSKRPPRRADILPYQDRIWRGTVTYPLHLPTDRPPLPAPELRTFAILETLPGMNVWDLGSSYENFTAVFGRKLHHWLLPVKHSPCCDHSSLISQYPLGPDFEELIIEAGLEARPEDLPPREDLPPDPKRPRKRRKRKGKGKGKGRNKHLPPGWEHGERPDTYYIEKEARRVRRERRRSQMAAPVPAAYVR